MIQHSKARMEVAQLELPWVLVQPVLDLETKLQTVTHRTLSVLQIQVQGGELPPVMEGSVQEEQGLRVEEFPFHQKTRLDRGTIPRIGFHVEAVREIFQKGEVQEVFIGPHGVQDVCAFKL